MSISHRNREERVRSTGLEPKASATRLRTAILRYVTRKRGHREADEREK
jgi:hypothetical protein